MEQDAPRWHVTLRTITTTTTTAGNSVVGTTGTNKKASSCYNVLPLRLSRSV